MDPESVYQALLKLSDFILRYAVTLAAVSVLSMALLEAFKTFVKKREKYHAQALFDWAMKSPLPERNALGELRLSQEEFRSKAYRQILELTTGARHEEIGLPPTQWWKPWPISSENALFALELEKMMGQIQSAADLALSNPGAYPELYLFLTAGADPDVARNWRLQWSALSQAQLSQDKDLAKTAADAYSRLSQFVRRKLDSFQLATSYHWKQWNQTRAVVLGGLLLLATLVYITPPKSLSALLTILLVSLLGGFAAPVAKDLVVALKKVRSGV